MNTFQRRTAIRIAAVSVTLASLASPIAWYVARAIFERLANISEDDSRQLLEDRVRQHFDM
jgi:hypothetical protein